MTAPILAAFDIDLFELGHTLNAHVHWATKRERTSAVRALTKAQALSRCKTRFTAPVRIHYRVAWQKGKRRLDWDNLAGALKPVQDGLVDAGIILKDTPDWITHVSYEQIRGNLPVVVVTVSVEAA